MDNDTKYENQQMLEALYAKNQLMPRIKQEFLKEEYQLIPYLEHHNIPEKFGIKLLCVMYLHKRLDVGSLVGIMNDPEERNLQETADLLDLCTEVDLVDWDGQRKQFILKYSVPADVQKEIDNFQFPLPMIVPPRTLKRNKDSAYFLGSGSLILKDNHHDDDIVLEHLNRMNSVQLKLNMEVVATISNKWRNLDKQKSDETYVDFQKRRKAFEKYDRTSKEVFLLLNSYSDTFYITHKVDKRGRTYCQGYHVNPQGNAWNKAAVHFAEGEIVEG